MLDTVAIALITFASGAVGALAGIVGTWVSARKQVQQTVIQEYFRVRLELFTSVWDAYSAFVNNRSDETRRRFIQAINSACLVASPNTAAHLRVFQTSVLFGNNAVLESSATADAMLQMQCDLNCFTTPTIKRNKLTSRALQKQRDQNTKRDIDPQRQ